MTRYIGLDIGDKRIGVAVSDDLGLTAQPVETYVRIGYGPDVAHFKALASKYDTQFFVCGLPLNMDGTSGSQAEKVFAFTQQLISAGFEVEYEDERLTTVLAEDALLEANMHRGERKRRVDMVAATFILQSWLDRMPVQQTDERQPDDLMEMTDADGNVVQFQRVAGVMHEGQKYLLLNEVTADSDGETLFLREMEGPDQELAYEAVDDEELLTALYDLYLKESSEAER